MEHGELALELLDTRELGVDYGYRVGQFPAGGLASGAETQELRISDSDAFNNLRGIAKTSFPFDPFLMQDSPNRKTSALADQFEQPELAGVSSLLPGRFSYNMRASTLSRYILDEFTAGASTLNSLPSAETEWGSSNFDYARRGVMNYAAGSGRSARASARTRSWRSSRAPS